MSTVNFNDKIFAQAALQAFTAAITPFNAFSRSYSNEAKQIGDAVAVPRVEVLTATTFNYSNNSEFPYEGSGGTVNAITVNLNNHRYVTVDLTDTQVANSSAAELENLGIQQGKALAKIVQTDVWASLVTANFGAAIITTVSVGDYSKDQVRLLRKTLAKRDVPLDNISLVFNEDAYDGLLGDSNITQAFQYGGSEAIREGRIPRLLGLDLYSTNILPLNSISLVGFAAHSDALAIAFRYLAPQSPGSYLAASQVVDPSGIVMGYRRHYNPGRGKMYASFECLFGFSVGLTLGLALACKAD